ncbi:MAG: hypothetical protein CBB72_011315 [Muricauda sp. TMED12]|mgnify:CR=1 FL=1|nr:MAG: hypothetical protein CBB72_011315 [Muricauda sp. TMED12]
MANTFKLKTFNGSSTGANTAMTVYTVPAATTTVVLGITLANISAGTVYATALVENNDGDNINLLKDIPIPTGSSVEVMSGNKLILETSDVLKIQSDTANSIDTALSIMEQA